MNKTLILLSAGVAIAALSACQTRQTGFRNANAPDEFRVVTKAPLTIPPEYGLRPPRAGGALPSEAQVEDRRSVAAFGTTMGSDASAAERALVAAAGANAANPVIRNLVDYEETQTIRRSAELTDRVTDYSGTEEEREAANTDNATGGDPVVIESSGRGKSLKLPGT